MVAQLTAIEKRPFTDGDFVKKCMMAAVETVCLEKIKLFSGFTFSAQTIIRRIRKISENVKYNQKDLLCLVLFAIFILHSRESELYRYTLDGKPALARELLFTRFMGHLSST